MYTRILKHLTVEVNYVQDVKWRRISANQIQFNCTLACRSSIGACVVQLNGTTYRTLNITKELFTTWAIVNTFAADAYQPFTYSVFAEDSSRNVLGKRVHGKIPPVSTKFNVVGLLLHIILSSLHQM